MIPNNHGAQRPRHGFSPPPALTANTTMFNLAPSPFDQLTSQVNNLSLDMAFAQTDHHVHRLNGFVISTTSLQKAGYITSPLSTKDLEMKKRCGRCHKGTPQFHTLHLMTHISLTSQPCSRACVRNKLRHRPRNPFLKSRSKTANTTPAASPTRYAPPNPFQSSH